MLERAGATVAHGDGLLVEEVVALGPDRLVGVLTTPPPPASPVTIVWLNAGSEPHTGPGRAWVEYARDLALAGHASLRLDFSGWGESPDLGHAPGRPYDAHGVEEALAAVGALRGLGHDRVVLAGVCAGAWVALQASAGGGIDGVVAINPQMYWQPGDPVEADIVTETHARREDEIARFAWGASVGLWDAMASIGVVHPAAEWLERLRGAGVPVLAAFAGGDDGLQFLEDRVGRSWAEVRTSGPVELAVLHGLDHPMHRHWERPALVRAVAGFLRRRVAPGGSGPAEDPPGP